MEVKVEASRRNKKFIEALMPSMFKQLKLENSKRVLLIRVADECGNDQGITMDLGENLGIVVVIKPRKNLKDVGLTLAHEMVHVKQYATGELRDYVKSTSLNRWQGKIIDDSKISYWDRPWEIEAFGREFGLYARFKESMYETKGHKT